MQFFELPAANPFFLLKPLVSTKKNKHNMSITSQHSISGQQVFDARSFSCSALVSESVINWQSISICPSPVGSRGRQYGLPGFEEVVRDECSKPSDSMPAQIYFSMKNAHKLTGRPDSDKLHNTPLVANSPAEPAAFEHTIFSQKAVPRPPESPEVESLRSLLKTNLAHEKASPALLERIRSGMQESKV